MGHWPIESSNLSLSANLPGRGLLSKRFSEPTGRKSWHRGGNSLIGIGAVAFYLDHCVIDQPLWAVVAGWGLLLGGFATLTLQDAVGTSRMTFIDIDHYWWPLGLVLIVIGATVILVSWWRAPELFSPHLSRRTVLALVPVVAIIVFARQSGMAPTVTLALCALIVSMALTAGSWMAGRSSGQSGGERDPA